MLASEETLDKATTVGCLVSPEASYRQRIKTLELMKNQLRHRRENWESRQFSEDPSKQLLSLDTVVVVIPS